MSSFMFSSDKSSLQRSLFIFIRASELNRDSPIVDLRAVLMSFSWLKLLSLSQEVIGSVTASFSRVVMLG